eukprot:TRINITY_DN6278_c0_g1_i2.p1 TRINITY_DN6278_c0_g1~~TRINITY_DN6278_c0_g1_i2.p1  ORF type:complete len:209 (+),score=22.36 TRINITY_DN6278_c0_g1_i2:127-753(+)
MHAHMHARNGVVPLVASIFVVWCTLALLAPSACAEFGLSSPSDSTSFVLDTAGEIKICADQHELCALMNELGLLSTTESSFPNDLQILTPAGNGVFVAGTGSLYGCDLGDTGLKYDLCAAAVASGQDLTPDAGSATDLKVSNGSDVSVMVIGEDSFVGCAGRELDFCKPTKHTDIRVDIHGHLLHTTRSGARCLVGVVCAHKCFQNRR